MTLAAALIVLSGPHNHRPHTFWAFARGSGVACSVDAHRIVCVGRGAAVRMNKVGGVSRCHCAQPHATRLLRSGHGVTAGLLGCDVMRVIRCQFADGAGFELSSSGRLKILDPRPVESRAARSTSGTLFTLAGAGSEDDALAEGRPAPVAPLPDPSALAALPDGETAKRFASFLVGSEGVVWRVDPQGRLQRVAGQSEDEGYTGDGGPALAAEVRPDHLAALPGGGFLLADEINQRVRMVAADGTITTVAGGGTSHADGIPARRAALDDPLAVAALPGGGLVIADDGYRVREVGPDGTIRTVAGGGRDDKIHGEAATEAGLRTASVAPEPDGSLLLADPGNGTIDRVTPDGTIHVAARPPRSDHVVPTLVTTLPGGGFAFAAVADSDGESALVYRVGPDGTVRRAAGGGPFAPGPLAGLTRRGDGGPATAIPLLRAVGLAALPDGGLLFSFDPANDVTDGDVVTYIAPETPALLAVALRRDGARVFRPGRPNAVHVALTLPATVTLRAGPRSVTRALPAGQSALLLPHPLAPLPHTVTLVAVDSAGRRAYDRAAVFPTGWLPEDTARIVVDAVAPNRTAIVCTRFAAGRIDCQDESDTDIESCRVVSVRYAQGRVRWGAYRGCEPRAHPRYTRAPRPLRRRDWHCVPENRQCEPALLGRVREADIVPQA